MKRMWLLMTSALLLALLLVACGGGDTNGDDNGSDDNDTNVTEDNGSVDQEATGTYNADEAEKLYQQSCASCHGGNLEGLNGPPLDKIGAVYSEDEIADIIANGKPGMPPGLLTGEDADQVAAWLADQK